MAQNIGDKYVFYGGYVDDVQLVKTIDELKEKFATSDLRFTGLTVTVQNFIDSIPADFWLTEGKFQKNWKLKTIQPLPSFETLASIPSEFLTEGFVVNIKDGTSYKFVGDATEEKDRWQQLPTQDSIDATIDDAVQLAVDKVTSGASEAFDTLGEIEAWINEHSGITEGGKTYKAGDGIQISEDDTISVDENKIKEIVSGDIAEVKDKMDSLSARVTLNEQSIDEVNNTIEKVKTDVKTITDKIDSKNSDIDSLSATVESINASLFLNQEETERVENKLDNFSGDVKTIIDGLSGKTGADGKSAYQIAVENGFSGDEKTWLESLVGKQGEQGPQGEKGTDGKSAFELAKATGYTGSESEWLESLKGADGTPGKDGKDGSSVSLKNSAEECTVANSDAYINKENYHIYIFRGEVDGKRKFDDLGEFAIVGPQGPQGEKGEQGIQGEKGEQGPQGEKGDKGEDGAPGKDGLSVTAATTASTDGGTIITFENADGAIGSVTVLNGKDGKDGAKGETGDKGSDGKSAYQIAVEKGFDGGDESAWIASLKGEKGAKGDKGDTGEQGPQGEKGEAFTYSDFTQEQLAALKGAKGDQGERGEKGEQGEKGEKGDQGPVGPQGPKGDDGKAVNIKKSAEECSNVDSDAYVDSNYHLQILRDISDSGEKTFEDLGQFAIVGPQGEQGPQGEKGEKGDPGEKGDTGEKGADGKSAYQIALDNNFIGSESDWLTSLKGAKGENGQNGRDGASGKSAYDIAVDEGFEGNEEAWLASLKGAKGDKGDTGEQGEKGADGTPGKSAYEIAKEKGFTGTTEEWLESLKGKTDFYSAGTGIDITEGVISVKDNYVTDEKLAEKNYLTEVPEDYAKKSDIPSLEGYVTEETLEAKKYLTEVPSEFANKIETVKVDGTALSIAEDKSVNINLSNYAKTTEVDEKYLSKDTASTTYQPKGNYLTEHQSLADYAKTTDVEEAYQKKGDYALKSDIIEYSAGDNVVIDGEHKISVASKTIEDIATSALTKALIPDDASESMDTLQEIAAWIQAHPEDAATMNSNISTVSGNVNKISGAVITNNEAIKANSERIDTINSDITKIENSIKNIQEGQVSGGTAVSIEDKIVNVKVAEGNDNFLKVNENNSLEVKEVTTNKTKTTAFIPVAGGPLAEDVKKVYPDGIPAGSDLQDVLMKLFCKEEWGKTNAPVYTFTASVGQPNINGTGITNGTSYVVGTKVSVGAMINDNITRTQKVEVNGMSYGYSGDTTASTATTYTQTKTPTFAGQETISCTFNGFTEVDKNVDGSAGAIKEFYVGLGNNSYTVNETGKTVSAAEFDSATIYAKSNLGNVSENGVTVSNEGFKASAAYKNGSITPTSTKTITVKGYYPVYYGAIEKVGTTADDLTEEIIKSKSYGENVLTSITLTAGTGTFFMAIPTGKAEFGKSEMITADAGGYSFGKSVVKTMKINMLNNVSQVDYKIFFITNATVLPNNTSYTIKFE